ncbi:hypothetical protein [Streptomyces sp. CBMA123]|uniref:hypothetical protein n=1 Tax=Streptomyces sp. CBMA123 TaxID=1896313 RepID=UPI001661CFD0|nr:hypothetical protein [Streptomyces sp. CBMA123]MBD0692010.1 hypothetical protein [Streptomyces sp. CBMA123]
MPVASLARPRAVASGEAATAEDAQGAYQAREFGSFRARDCGRRSVEGTAPPVVRFSGPLARPLTGPLAGRPEAARELGVRAGLAVGGGVGSAAGVDAVIGTVFAVRARLIAVSVASTPTSTPVGAPTGALVGLPADRVGVRTGVVSLGPRIRTAGRIRFDRSGGLKTSHGSRLFKGEGPTGEDNAARATGPPTG